MEAIAYVKVGDIGYVPLAEAVLARWKADGTKPTVELYGEEIVELAREINRKNLLAAKAAEAQP